MAIIGKPEPSETKLDPPEPAGLEEEAVVERPAVVAEAAAERVEEWVSELGRQVAPAVERVEPMRILVDTNRVGPEQGDSRVLRMAELGIRLKLEGGLPIEVAGIAAEEELKELLAQFSGEDERSRSLRDLLGTRIFTYQAGDPESHEAARKILKIAFPEFEGVKPITTVDNKVVQWLLAGLEELGVPPESFTPEFREQIQSFLALRHAA
jgi:hypothetical protein